MKPLLVGYTPKMSLIDPFEIRKNNLHRIVGRILIKYNVRIHGEVILKRKKYGNLSRLGFPLTSICSDLSIQMHVLNWAAIEFHLDKHPLILPLNDILFHLDTKSNLKYYLTLLYILLYLYLLYTEAGAFFLQGREHCADQELSRLGHRVLIILDSLVTFHASYSWFKKSIITLPFY